ncbi:Acyl dehydratase [Streptomyces zhaozhouensis]|uniref:Acyl dehydratase n=1 Tax=Streptomyces zhaozhouensis TaxID=1300267 RepID=A0A286DZC6_9ACTN|nr:MaoC/PaaZ C-terminal domain-containing protein [Streptomyces zhaozhouensis]SOD64015.1 Acyl dehydratase [Streptomyces zhaozhouensis]
MPTTDLTHLHPPGLLPSYARALLPRRRNPERPLPARTLRLTPVPREPGRLREYARVCGFPAPATAGRLPATYPHLSAFPLAMRLLTASDFPHPPLGLVHLANEITQLRPLTAEERLSVAVRAAPGAPHPRGTAFAVTATVSDEDGAEVWRSASTYLHRHGGAGGPGRGARPGPAERELNAPTREESWPLAADLGRRYARVSGDRNPIHLYPLTARPFGFRRPIAHGMWSTARALAALDEALPEAFTARVRFRAPAPLPSRPTFRAAELPEGQAFHLVGEGGRLLLAGEVTPP